MSWYAIDKAGRKSEIAYQLLGLEHELVRDLGLSASLVDHFLRPGDRQRLGRDLGVGVKPDRRIPGLPCVVVTLFLVVGSSNGEIIDEPLGLRVPEQIGRAHV